MKRKSRNRRHAVPAQPHHSQASHPSQAAASAPPEPPPINPVRPELKGLVARVMLTPEMTAATSMSRVMDPCLKESGIDLMTVAELLDEQGQAVADGDLSLVRRTLTAQVAMLDRIFHHLFTLATVGSNTPETCSCFMRLALRAQTQSARTAAILARLGGAAQVKPVATPSHTPMAEAAAPVRGRSSRFSHSVPAEPRRQFMAPVPLHLTKVSPRVRTEGAASQLTGSARCNGLSARTE